MNGFEYHEGEIAGGENRLGLVVLRSDETIEHDFRRIFPPERCGLMVTRIQSSEEVTSVTLAAMAGHLTTAARLFPAGVEFDVVGYGCTSGTAVIGADKIAELVRAGCAARHVTNPLTALIATCRARNIKRLTFLSPYIEPVSQHIRQALADQDIGTPVFGSFNVSMEATVARINAESVREAAHDLDRDTDTDAVFLSCTNLQTLDVIPQLEQDLAKPVLSSNSVLSWHMETLAGL